MGCGWTRSKDRVSVFLTILPVSLHKHSTKNISWLANAWIMLHTLNTCHVLSCTAGNRCMYAHKQLWGEVNYGREMAESCPCRPQLNSPINIRGWECSGLWYGWANNQEHARRPFMQYHKQCYRRYYFCIVQSTNLSLCWPVCCWEWWPQCYYWPCACLILLFLGFLYGCRYSNWW